jgi:hypothetical protein
MNFIKKANESWLLNVATDVNLTGRVNKSRLIIKKNKEDADNDAVFSQEVTVSDPAAFSVLFTVPSATTHEFDGQYFYEVWTYNTAKTDAILCDEGTVVFENPILDEL